MEGGDDEELSDDSTVTTDDGNALHTDTKRVRKIHEEDFECLRR